VDLYIHFLIRLHGVVLNKLSTGTTSSYPLDKRLCECRPWRCTVAANLLDLRYSNPGPSSHSPVAICLQWIEFRNVKADDIQGV
jgi:hypothetical protein